MQNKKPEKKKPEGIAGAIAVIGFGVLWTVGAISITHNSPFGILPSIILPGFGILFTGAIISKVVKAYRDGGQEEQENESTDRDTELVNRIVGAVKETQPQHKTEKWTCAYCGTVVDGKDTYCPGCGAGRK